MNFLILFLFIFSGVGITNLVVNATILDYPRQNLINLSKIIEGLLTCMMCSGFWVGFFLSFYFGINPFIGAAIISLFSNIFGILADLIYWTSYSHQVREENKNEY